MSSLFERLTEIGKEVRALESEFHKASEEIQEINFSYYYSKGALDYKDKLLDEIEKAYIADLGVKALLRSIVVVTSPDPYQKL